jgi:hypothetical protein
MQKYKNVKLQLSSSKEGSCVSTTRNACTISNGESKRKRPLGRIKRRCDGHIKSNLKVIQRGLIQSALEKDVWWAFVNGEMEFRVSYKGGKCLPQLSG